MRKLSVLVAGCLAAVCLTNAQPVFAATKTNRVIEQGTAWLGGYGVPVYSNDGDYNSDANDKNYVDIGSSGHPQYVLSGYRWQCVELVNRLYLAKGWITSNWRGNGSDMYATAPSNLQKEPNGQIASLQPGDVISFGGGWGGYGHVAIVDHVSNATVWTVSQNLSDAGDATVATFTWDKTHGTVSHWSGYSTIGVIRAPADPSGAAASQTKPRDATRDFRADLAWHQGTSLFLLTGQQNGTFQYGGVNAAAAPIGEPGWAGSGDVDGDGQTDVIWYQNGTLTLLKWSNNAWQLAGQTFGIGAPDAAVAGDFNGDGHADLAWHQGTSLFLLAGQANGTFSWGGVNAADAPIYTPDWLGSGDVDANGRAEVYWHLGSNLVTLKWTGSTWAFAGQTTGIGPPDHAVAGDFDGDGRTDLAWHEGNVLTMFQGQTNGTFTWSGTNSAAAPIGAADWAGAGSIDGTSQRAQAVLWYQNGALVVLKWSRDTWQFAGATNGIGTPDHAVVLG